MDVSGIGVAIGALCVEETSACGAKVHAASINACNNIVHACSSSYLLLILVLVKAISLCS